jgi:hypothetical protein
MIVAKAIATRKKATTVCMPCICGYLLGPYEDDARKTAEKQQTDRKQERLLTITRRTASDIGDFREIQPTKSVTFRMTVLSGGRSLRQAHNRQGLHRRIPDTPTNTIPRCQCELRQCYTMLPDHLKGTDVSPTLVVDTMQLAQGRFSPADNALASCMSNGTFLHELSDQQHVT